MSCSARTRRIFASLSWSCRTTGGGVQAKRDTALALDFPDRIQDEVGFLDNAVEFCQVRFQLAQAIIAVRGEFQDHVGGLQHTLNGADGGLHRGNNVVAQGRTGFSNGELGWSGLTPEEER